MMDGISVRSDVLSTNDNGEEKESVRKRTAKTLQKLRPALQRILRPEEVVLYAMPACASVRPVDAATPNKNGRLHGKTYPRIHSRPCKARCVSSRKARA
jgi:hypothetical protein